jgi:stearoyl-CoA 9-desaturase NADPH oxidoreductase
MGVCHTCIGRLRTGRIRDLRSGDVSDPEGEMVRTCIHAPEGPVEIEL